MQLKKLSELFKIDNKIAELAPTQLMIFESIVLKKNLRVIMILPTQYGKSLSVALAVITRAVIFGEKFLIVAPSEKKAKIIMGYVIDHIGDNVLFRSQLEIDSRELFEKLKRERSKNRLTFRRGGEIMTLTLDSRNSKKSLEAAMGFGVGENGNVILDESSLIDDPLYASVKRMCSGKNAMLFEIGNPFYRNHFHKTYNYDKNYFKVFADYKTAVEEGRFTAEFIEEMRGQAFFDVYYECVFPDEDLVDDKGYRQLVVSKELEYEDFKIEDWSKVKLGCDIGGGGDLNVFIARIENKAKVVHTNQSNDTMTNVTEIGNFIEKGVLAENINIDDIGIGRGVSDRCKEKGWNVNGVNVGESSREKNKYQNRKAELYDLLKDWIKQGGKLEEFEKSYISVWLQLTWIKYKVNSDKQIKIEPKQDLKRKTGKSPDFAEALMLTFYEQDFIGFV